MKGSRNQSITLKFLADRAGVSIRTVNRVLKNESGVQEDKRRLILSLAAEYHYIPNMAARNLKTSRRRFVGIICNSMTREINARKLTDLELRLTRAGLYPLLGSFCGDTEIMRSMLLEWAGVAACAIVLGGDGLWPAGSLDQMLKICRDLPLKFIFVEQSSNGCFDELWIDRSAGILEGLQYFRERGARRILRCGRVRSRTGAYVTAADTMPELDIMTLSCGAEFADGYAAGAEIAAAGAEVVFFDTDRQAMGFLNYAQTHGIRIPEECAIVGFDDDSSGRVFRPSLATVAHPVEELNEELVRRVSGAVTAPSGGEHSTTFRTYFVPRETSGR